VNRGAFALRMALPSRAARPAVFETRMIPFRASAAVFAVAAVMAGCSQEAAPPAETSAQAPTQTAEVAPPAPVAQPGPQTVAPCRTAQLALSADGGDAGMGHRVAILGVRNTAVQTCSLTGYPDVVLLDSQGRELSKVRVEQNASSYLSSGPGPSPVELAPGAKAYFDIAWTVVPNEGEGETVCPSAAAIRFSAPGDTATTSFAQSFTPCGGRIQVRPLRATAEDTPPT
jgi:hypothetical protein